MNTCVHCGAPIDLSLFHGHESKICARCFIESVTAAFNEVEPETDEGINETLRDAGYDPEELAQRGREFVAGLLAQAQHDEGGEKPQ